MELNLTDEGTRVNPPSVWNTANKSDQHLVEVSTNKLFYKRKPSLRKLKLTLLLAAIFLFTLCAIIVFLGLNCIKVTEELTELKSICRSPECIRSASSLLLSMNKSVNPCEDFYEYTCGRWHEEHPVQSTFTNNDWFNERTQVVLAKIKDFLQKNSSDSEAYPTTQAKMMYEACIDTDRIEELDLDPLTDVLSDMRLPLNISLQEADYDLDLDINSLIAWILTTTGKDMILHTSVIPDVVNRTRNVITVGPPDPHSILPGYNVYKRKRHFPADYHLRKQLVNDKSTAIGPWRRYFSSIFKYFLKKNNVTVPDGTVANATYTLIQIYFEIQLVINNENITTPNDPHPTMMTLSELQSITDEAAESVNLTSKINWQQYMETLFEISNSTIDYENDELAVYTLEYYKAISKVLAKYSDYEIVLYLWSEVVSALIPYSNEDLRTLRHYFLSSFGEPAALPREVHCTTALWEVMDKAIAVGLIEDADIEHIRADVGKMIDNIEYSLTKFIREADWIDSETRAAIIDKAKSIKRYIGYPDWMLKAEELEEYYAGLNVSEDTHMYNFINLAQIIVKGNLDQLNVENDYSDSDFDPLEVNAQYIPTANSINIPLGILQFPFYDLGIDALNYGAVGVIIGHELTHAFDNTGREYDKVGNVNEWWTNDTTENYLGRVECFIDHYNSYIIDEIDESVNGNLTLSENIADNGGVKDAFHGFQKLKEDEDYKELKLPGLEEFSSDKLFYLGFAHSWCENWTPKSMKQGLEDEHSPNFARVLGTLKNSKEFSKIWNCPSDSKMNIKMKCQLW